MDGRDLSQDELTAILAQAAEQLRASDQPPSPLDAPSFGYALHSIVGPWPPRLPEPKARAASEAHDMLFLLERAHYALAAAAADPATLDQIGEIVARLRKAIDDSAAEPW